MAAPQVTPALPPGFMLESDVPQAPAGFKMEAQAEIAPPPGFVMEADYNAASQAAHDQAVNAKYAELKAGPQGFATDFASDAELRQMAEARTPLPEHQRVSWEDTARAIPATIAGGFKQMAGGALQREGEIYREDANDPRTMQGNVANLMRAFGGSNMVDESLKGAGVQAAEGSRIAREGINQARTAIPSGKKLNIVQESALSGVNSLAQMAPGAAVSVATKSPIPMLGIMGAQTQAQTYATARNPVDGSTVQVSPRVADLVSTLDGFVETGTEIMPAIKMFERDIGLKKRLIGLIIAEGGSEMAAATFQDIDAKLSYNPNMTWADYIHDMQVTVLSTAMSAPVQAGAAHGLHTIARRVAGQPGKEPVQGEPIPGNVEDILSGDARNAAAAGVGGQPALPAPRIIVNSAGEAVPESQMPVGGVNDMGTEEVAGTVHGRAPLPVEPPVAAQRALPAPVMVGTPEGEVGSQSQVEANRAAQATRGTDLGLNEVAGAVQKRAPLPEASQGTAVAAKQPDDLLKAIAKAGGLSREAAQSEGIDPAYFADKQARQVFGRPLFPKAGGFTMDALAEHLAQTGYLPPGQYSANDALNLIARALSGEKIYSQQNAGQAFDLQAQENDAAQRDQGRNQPGPVSQEYRAGDLRGRIEAVQRARIKDTLGDEAAKNWQPKPDDFGLSGYNKSEPDVQDLSEAMFEGRRVLGEDAFESFFERFSVQNANLSGVNFETSLIQAIKGAENEQRSSPAGQNKPGHAGVQEAVQAGVQPPQGRQTAGEAQAVEQKVSQPVTAPAATQASDGSAPAAAATVSATPQPQEERRADAGNRQERRTDTGARARVADMSEPELRAALLTDPLTGLPNRRAYEESEKKAVQAALDLDGLKWINDTMGHESGDKMLAEMGHAMAESGLDAYHLSGDEFMVQGDDRIAVERGIEAVRLRLDNAKVHVERPDGSSVTKTGVHFAYGIGSTRNEADQALGKDKADREATGLRNARGEAPRGVERRAAGQPDRQHQGAAEVVQPNTPPRSQTESAGVETPPKGGVSASGQRDLLGQDTRTAQQVHDARQAVEDRLRGKGKQDVAPDTGGGLFSQEQKQVDIEQAAHSAATSPKNNLPEPTTAQKESGNYQKGHITLHGLDISIENPAGSRRRPEWPPLAHHYGYIKGTIGADKDHIDVFLSPKAEDAGLPVFVVDQVHKDKTFDEHKILMGFRTAVEAKQGYLENYTPGWTGFGAMKRYTLDEFKQWLETGNTKKPVAYGYAEPKPSQTPPVVSSKPSAKPSSESRSTQPVAESHAPAPEAGDRGATPTQTGAAPNPIENIVTDLLKDDRLKNITVSISAIEAESGKAITVKHKANILLRETQDQLELARRLLECLSL